MSTLTGPDRRTPTAGSGSAPRRRLRPTDPAARRARRRERLGWIATHSIAIALGLAFLTPLIFIVLTALMTDQQALTSVLWPKHFQWSNFTDVFRKAPLLTWLGNSALYAGLATCFTLVSAVPVAYALARLRWRGRNAAFLLVIAMMLLPPQITQVPIYVMWARLHLTGTLWPLVVPPLLGDAFSIFLLRQFLLTIPEEYSLAARVDGCSEIRVLLKVILPMAKPALSAVALFQFFNAWNDYYGPLIYTSEVPSHWTLALGLASFRTVHGAQWNLTMAATVLVMAPVIVVFFFAQKAFIEGVTLTGVKG